MMSALSEVRTMQAAILAAQRQPLVVDEVSLPERLEFGQVLVRVVYSGICGAQLNEIDGTKGPDPYLPHLLGHEGSGVVLEAGPGVKTVPAGQRVVMHWRKGRGIEAPTPRYRWRGQSLNAGWVTTFNQYAIVSENRVTPIPDGLELDVAPLLGCAVTSGLGVITNNARVRIGESVVVFGAGGVGLNVIQGAVLAGAHPIVAVDLYDAKLEFARKFGATHTINSRQTNARSPRSSASSAAAGRTWWSMSPGRSKLSRWPTSWRGRQAASSWWECLPRGRSPPSTPCRCTSAR